MNSFEIHIQSEEGNYQTHQKRRKNSHLSDNSKILLKNLHLTFNRFPGFPQIPTHKGKPCEKLCSASEHLSIFINIICQYKYFPHNFIFKIGVHQTGTYNVQRKQFSLRYS